MRAEHFCAECGHVQPAEPTDYFSFFGLPRRLELEEEALESEFYALSRKLHPDVYSRASTREQAWSLEKTSQLNDAYRTLKDPISRTEYLLMLEGIQLEEQSKTATEQARASGVDKKQTVPAELLEEAFELNMLLEEAKLGGVDERFARATECDSRGADGAAEEDAGRVARGLEAVGQTATRRLRHRWWMC